MQVDRYLHGPVGSSIGYASVGPNKGTQGGAKEIPPGHRLFFKTCRSVVVPVDITIDVWHIFGESSRSPLKALDPPSR